MRITRVYTKTGDDGTTGLAGGQRVQKNDARIAAFGAVDELAAAIGIARVEVNADATKFSEKQDAAALDSLLEFIGNKLFTLGGDLATKVADRHPKMPVIVADDIVYLERTCDKYNAALPPLTDFILPGGSRSSAALHLARTVARRAERDVLTLMNAEEIGDAPLKYLNRLSDALFVLARWVNARQGIEEVIWRRDLPEPQ
ncbi:cob(I)yrinic acid a,c-diamide adenosyltransferase [soil metagenome]